MLLSVLPRLTRPSASRDRARILELAFVQGFDLVEVSPSLLSYASPPFEVSSLRAEGLWEGDWRSGDLFVFRKTLRKPQQRTEVLRGMSEGWESFTIGTVSVRIKKTLGRKGALTFEPASLTGDIHLHSVSRRSPIRSGIDLWTSRNLALKITRPDYVLDALLLEERGMTFPEAIVCVSRNNSLDAASQQTLTEIVNLLLRDSGLLSHV